MMSIFFFSFSFQIFAAFASDTRIMHVQELQIYKGFSQCKLLWNAYLCLKNRKYGSSFNQKFDKTMRHNEINNKYYFVNNQCQTTTTMFYSLKLLTINISDDCNSVFIFQYKIVLIHKKDQNENLSVWNDCPCATLNCASRLSIGSKWSEKNFKHWTYLHIHSHARPYHLLPYTGSLWFLLHILHQTHIIS